MHVEPLPIELADAAAPDDAAAPGVDSTSGPQLVLSGEVTLPQEPRALLVLAHGAGAGYRHASMLSISEALCAVDVATLRFNLPFMEAGRRRVDPPGVAIAAIVRAAAAGRARLPQLPLLVGGHSFGGRMASHAVAQGRLSADALICMSFPLHPPHRAGLERAEHLPHIHVPMLFLSGTRDALAQRDLLSRVVDSLPGDARLHWLDDADHGYRVRKRRRQDPRTVFDEMAETVRDFLASLR